MPAPVYKNPLLIVGVLGLFITLWTFGLPEFLTSPFTNGDMTSISSPFTINVDGTPIAKIPADSEDVTHASVGSDAAVFTFKDGRLESGDWVLGRNMTEDRSFHPKKVYWFKSSTERTVQETKVQKEGDSYKVKFGNGDLTIKDGKLFALIGPVGGDPATVEVNMQ